MEASDPLSPKAGLEQSIRLVGQALDILDACNAPPQIAANLEMALAEMKSAVADCDNRRS